MSDLLELADGMIHLWYANTSGTDLRKWLDRCGDLMSSDERKRQQRFVFQKDRDQFLIARVLLRTTLSRYVSNRPEDWRFRTNKYGKPELALDQSVTPLRFNLSHCDGLVLCGVTVGHDIGVDCENLNRKVDFGGLAERAFSERERRFLKSVSDKMVPETFFRFWTLKEAYIKARGLGMSLPLQMISFDIFDKQAAQISFGPEIQDTPSNWQLIQPGFSAPHIAAVAIHLPQYQTAGLKLFNALE